MWTYLKTFLYWYGDTNFYYRYTGYRWTLWKGLEHYQNSKESPRRNVGHSTNCSISNSSHPYNIALHNYEGILHNWETSTIWYRTINTSSSCYDLETIKSKIWWNIYTTIAETKNLNHMWMLRNLWPWHTYNRLWLCCII